jgi:hypothetical protein
MTLQMADVTLKMPAEQLTKIAGRLKEYYASEYGEDLPDWIMLIGFESYLLTATILPAAIISVRYFWRAAMRPSTMLPSRLLSCWP